MQEEEKSFDRFFCTPLVMKFDEKAGYVGNSQRVNQDCFHAHTSEDSCDGDSTDAPLSNWPSQAASTRCMASDYQNDRTCHSNIVSSCWLLQTVWPVEQSASFWACRELGKVWSILSGHRPQLHHFILPNPRSINQTKVPLDKLSLRAE